MCIPIVICIYTLHLYDQRRVCECICDCTVVAMPALDAEQLASKASLQSERSKRVKASRANFPISSVESPQRTRQQSKQAGF